MDPYEDYQRIFARFTPAEIVTMDKISRLRLERDEEGVEAGHEVEVLLGFCTNGSHATGVVLWVQGPRHVGVRVWMEERFGRPGGLMACVSKLDYGVGVI